MSKTARVQIGRKLPTKVSLPTRSQRIDALWTVSGDVDVVVNFDDQMITIPIHLDEKTHRATWSYDGPVNLFHGFPHKNEKSIVQAILTRDNGISLYECDNHQTQNILEGKCDSWSLPEPKMFYVQDFTGQVVKIIIKKCDDFKYGYELFIPGDWTVKSKSGQTAHVRFDPEYHIGEDRDPGTYWTLIKDYSGKYYYETISGRQEVTVEMDKFQDDNQCIYKVVAGKTKWADGTIKLFFKRDDSDQDGTLLFPASLRP